MDQAGSLLGLTSAVLANVRYWVNSGRHMLAASSSGFDPEPTSGLICLAQKRYSSGVGRLAELGGM
jgi:hypothetical protein